MGENLFEGLPPPSSLDSHPTITSDLNNKQQSVPVPPAPISPPPPPLKSALKRSKPPESQLQVAAPERRLRFKTTTDATETQLIEAMQKIGSHIKNPSKFGKASKLAIQLINAGSVKSGTSDHFFAVLEAAMSSPTTCTSASVRADYHALLTAAQDAAEWFNKKQKNELSTWTMRAVVANELFTDDSFVFSKAATRIKEAITNLPNATEWEDNEEVEVADANTLQENNNNKKKRECDDPFGLDVLISKNKDALKKQEEEEEKKRFVKCQREALVICLDIAARRYNTPWCQTVIDMLVKHASDNISRFTSLERKAIVQLWNSIREQHARRKQGKSVSGKLELNGFEWLQQKYANQKISIRRGVGGGGSRKAQQWLG